MELLSDGSLRWLAATLLLLASGSRPGTAQLLGPEFPVNGFTTSVQVMPAVAVDGDGDFVVVWTNYGAEEGSFGGVFGQRFDSAGTSVGSEFPVNSYTTSFQYEPGIAADGAGSFVVVWTSYGQDGDGEGVFGQRFDALGFATGSEFRVNSYTTDTQRNPAVAADSTGNFVVAWNSWDQDGDRYGVFGQRFDSSGSAVGSEFRVNSYTTSYQERPDVAMDGAGNFVVVWASADQEGPGDDVFGKRYDASGVAVGSEFRVNSYTTDNQRDAAVAADNSGSFVVVWKGPGDGSGDGIFGQRFDSLGGKVGNEFRANSYTTSYQLTTAVAVDGAGNFVVVWESYGQDGSTWGVFGQRYDSSGESVGSEFAVNSYTALGQASPAVAADGAGEFVAVWDSLGQDGDREGVFGRRLSWLFANGFEAGDACAWSSRVGSVGSCLP